MEVSDLLHYRLEANAERYEEIRDMNFGLGIPSECWPEFSALPYKQARLREEWVNALRTEGRSVSDITTLFDDSPEPPIPGLRIENHSDAIRIYMWGEIGTDFTASDLKTEMEQFPLSTIELHVNSEGGSVPEGVAISQLIQAHEAPVNVIVDSLAASAASFSIMTADSISMALGSYMMIHFCRSALLGGTAEDFAEAAKRMKEVNENLKTFYRARWKGTEAQLDAALLQETYFSAEECVTAGLADKVISVERVAACVGSRFKHETAPVGLSIAARGGPSQFLNHPSRQMVLHRLISHHTEQ